MVPQPGAHNMDAALEISTHMQPGGDASRIAHALGDGEANSVSCIVIMRFLYLSK